MPERKSHKYKTQTNVLIISGWTESECSDILFLNTAPLTGGAAVTVRGVTLQPGQFLSIQANEWELDETQYEVIFATTGIPNLTVVRKLYTGEV